MGGGHKALAFGLRANRAPLLKSPNAYTCRHIGPASL